MDGSGENGKTGNGIVERKAGPGLHPPGDRSPYWPTLTLTLAVHTSQRDWRAYHGLVVQVIMFSVLAIYFYVHFCCGKWVDPWDSAVLMEKLDRVGLELNQLLTLSLTRAVIHNSNDGVGWCSNQLDWVADVLISQPYSSQNSPGYIYHCTALSLSHSPQYEPNITFFIHFLH